MAPSSTSSTPAVALANMMRMTQIGGSLIVWTPANNLCGHGFYQFSPEFFFSSLSGEHGFNLRQVSLVECVFPSVSLVEPRRSFAVRSPYEARSRVEVLSKRPLMLLVHAVKTAHLDTPFARPPQQSDYVAAWEGRQRRLGRRAATLGGVRQRGLRVLRATERGRQIARIAQGVAERRRHSLRNRRFFTRQ